jgi:DNA-directed RNA polymerase specialized sigma24 family protein
MDRTAAIDDLPEAYAAALRLRDAGLTDKAIAARLGIEVEAVDALLRVAVAKLAAILAANDPSAQARQDGGNSD